MNAANLQLSVCRAAAIAIWLTLLVWCAQAAYADDAAKPAAPAVSGKTLDELLERVRTADLRDNAANKEREARFAAAATSRQTC